jgi:hypothetical protein
VCSRQALYLLTLLDGSSTKREQLSIELLAALIDNSVHIPKLNTNKNGFDLQEWKHNLQNFLGVNILLLEYSGVVYTVQRYTDDNYCLRTKPIVCSRPTCFGETIKLFQSHFGSVDFLQFLHAVETLGRGGGPATARTPSHW